MICINHNCTPIDYYTSLARAREKNGPCPLTKIVRDVLHSLPLVFRLVPRSVLRLNDPLRSRGIDSGRGEGTEQEEEPTGA